MDEDNDQVDIPEVPDLPTVEEGQQDTTDWKAKAQESHDALKKAQGMAKRFQTKLKKLGDPKPAPASDPKPNATPEKKGFDYAEKAYLKSSGIDATEFDLVKEVMEATGKDIDGVLGSKYFQADLKERREAKASDGATPSGSKRAGNSTRDSVDYWIAKGELPPLDQPDLRRKVVNAKIKAAKDSSHFTKTPVVRG